MEEDLYKNKAEADLGYEFSQVITDFGNPVEIFREAFQNAVDENATEVYCRVHREKQLGKEDLIIDIWDNGTGLREENVKCFFGLAKSTKIKKDKTPVGGKYGYKGHGTKPFFKSELVEIFSKPDLDKPGWGVILKDPLKQIQDKGIYFYSNPIDESKCRVRLPQNINQGFFLRIRNPFHFSTQHTWYMLNHLYLRDYAKWFTVFGTIRVWFDPNMFKAKLYLSGLNIEDFKNTFDDLTKIDPIPKFIEKDKQLFEEIEMGHYFPPRDRFTEPKMKEYAKRVNDNKPYYDYYSKLIVNHKYTLPNNVHFYFLVNSEGCTAPH